MKHNIARRMQDIAPFHVMKLLARAREIEAQGNTVVHMEIGEPDFETPQPIVQAGITALQQAKTHYTPALGLSELRHALADFYQSRYQTNLSASNIVITPGSSGALQLICGVLINPGDEVLMTDPGYPCNKHFVQLMGGVPRFINLNNENNYQISLQDVKNAWTDSTKAILLASPSNPTGVVIDVETLKAIALFAKENNAYLIVDEIYHGLVYEQSVETMANKLDNVFVLNSFSKYFCMTGWRIGWLIAPTEFIEPIDKLAQNIFLAASTPAQYAALAAFQQDTMEILEAYRLEFQKRRDYLYQALISVGFKLKQKPQGAFYLYCDCSDFTDDSFQLTNDLLEQAGVAITPGIDFGNYKAEQHVRFAYTQNLEQLELGMQRLTQFLSKL